MLSHNQAVPQYCQLTLLLLLFPRFWQIFSVAHSDQRVPMWELLLTGTFLPYKFLSKLGKVLIPNTREAQILNDVFQKNKQPLLDLASSQV